LGVICIKLVFKWIGKSDELVVGRIEAAVCATCLSTLELKDRDWQSESSGRVPA
jgi:hypothetical protein